MKIPTTFPPTEPAIEIVNGNPLTTDAYGTHCSTVDELVKALENVRKENKALRNLAENLQPGPISEALAATLHVATWRQRAAHWLHEVAAQELIDAVYAGHSGVSAKERAAFLNGLADRLGEASTEEPDTHTCVSRFSKLVQLIDLIRHEKDRLKILSENLQVEVNVYKKRAEKTAPNRSPPGTLEVGTSVDEREVVVNAPYTPDNGSGFVYFAFTPRQAMRLATTLLTKARECKSDVVTFGGKKPEGT